MLFEIKENQPWESRKPNHVYDHKLHLHKTVHYFLLSEIYSRLSHTAAHWWWSRFLTYDKRKKMETYWEWSEVNRRQGCIETWRLSTSPCKWLQLKISTWKLLYPTSTKTLEFNNSSMSELGPNKVQDQVKYKKRLGYLGTWDF